MFVHAGFGSIWPVIFFLPWVLLRGAYLLVWVLRRRVIHRRLGGVARSGATGPSIRGLILLGVSVSLAAAQLAIAAPATEEHKGCPVSTPEAHLLGDRLFEEGSYQAAGECYLAAGDYDRANRAFVKAVGPASATMARQMSEQGEQAKRLLHNLRVAVRPQH